MNYYVTYCDKNYIQHAEKLFELLAKYSKYKIIVLTIDFKYESKFDNVISIYHEKQSNCFVRNSFLKPVLCNRVLELFPYDDFCYVDADIIPLINCDEIFESINKISSYPLFARQCHDYIFHHDPEVDKNHEINLLKYLNNEVKSRSTIYYRQGCIFLFNETCHEFIKKWSFLCENEFILKNYKIYSPIYDETIANSLLWIGQHDDFLGRIHIDFPNFQNKNIYEFLFLLTNKNEQEILYDSFTRILKNKDINQIKFLHGKISDMQYNIIKSFLENQKTR